MVKHGFKPLPEEWWHFTLVDEPYPDTYFDFPVSRSSLLTNASDIEDQNNNKVKEQSDEGVLDPLSYWTTESAARTSLVSYVASVTDENSPDFIPVRDRIAVFDLDGTLFCETDPNYFDYCLLEYRVLDDPTYKDKASDFEKEVALKIRDQNQNHTSYKGLEVDHGKAVASAFAGMTIEEFNQYIQAFKAQPMPGYNNMTRGQSFYLPMVQVVNFLQAYDFTVYIVSGTDRFIVRGIIDNSILDIPPRQIIGSDETIKSNDQGDEDGLNYIFEDDDVLILGGEFIVKNLKMNKVSVIAQEIGQQPVLSFGNSTGDLSMCEYVVSNNKYKSMAFMLCCDDTVRENGNVEKADKMYALCDECDFVPISMKNDWTTIYGDNVTRK
jgi:FMN phosphatase YigB (HAD superfamily)